jgi:membrane protein
MSKRKKIYIFCREFYKIFNEERVLLEASSLTYVTVLGIIPFTLFLLTFFPDINTLNLVDQFKTLLISILLPESAEPVMEYFDNLFDTRASLNVINIIMLIVTSYALLNSIITVFDRILKLDNRPRRRTIGTLFKMFGMVVLGFFVFALLISTASLPYFQGIFALNIINNLVNLVLPLLFWFGLINFAYYFIPNAKIKHKSIWISTTFSAIIWFLAKIGFDYFINNLTQMKQIYGILSSFPILLMWIYLNWIFVLSGVVLMSLLNNNNSKPKEYELTAHIQLTVNKKVKRDYISELEMSDDEKSLLKNYIADLLTKKNKK